MHTFAVLDTYAINDDGTRDHMAQVTLKGPHILKQAARLTGLGSKHLTVTRRRGSYFHNRHRAHIHCALGREGHLVFFFA